MGVQSHCAGVPLLSIRMCLKKIWLGSFAHVGMRRDESVKSTDLSLPPSGCSGLGRLLGTDTHLFANAILCLLCAF